MIFSAPPPDRGRPGSKARWQALSRSYRADETATVETLLAAAPFDGAAQTRIAAKARDLALKVREDRATASRVDAFLQEYALSSVEGVALMCLAEALLRIPDGETADRLIREKLATGDWERHLGHSESLLVRKSVV